MIFLISFKNSFLMLLGLQLMVYINRFFSKGEIDQFEFFIDKGYLYLCLRVWAALFIIYVSGYFIAGKYK
ncbi:hypothetical protein [Rodentibacter trehalosifermentans]|uniref:Uncharacterized protein n=1 Tax=Rodentibacter trehalosifermentans TaxID=1908263 RepID=A0A1V3IXE2_9PAST|nr:hypothetical protein [Rodentibacter trehalosifermentans]OOF46637.1 hypothetical protein BKK52_11180 [Rodentibacter trehalosifermentans]OOF51489.1 hypothetical protein BKK53_07210 [Rodentibacter trehalosifermentans]